MLYLSVFVLLSFAAIFSLTNKKSSKASNFFYGLAFIIMTLMLCFRYGQGTDYFNYNYLLNSYSDWHYVINSNDHGEIGFRLLCYIFNGNYELFIFCISAVEMLLLNHFIKSFSDNKNVSIWLFYPTFYLIYFFSGIRQGIVLALFLGVGYSLLQRQKYIKYIVFILLLSTIHTVALVYLLVLIVKRFKTSTIIIMLPISFVIGIAGMIGSTTSLFAKIPYIGSMLLDNIGTTFSILATVERLFMLFAMLLLYRGNADELEQDTEDMLKIYLFGYMLYFVFLPFATLATRIMICFKIVEIILIPYFLIRRNSFKQLFIVFILALSTVSYFHNISASISQGNYYSFVNVLNYPYFSLLDKNSITDYRNIIGEFLD